MTEKISLSKAEAAAAVSVSERTIARAIKTTEKERGGVPPLRCRYLGNKPLIAVADLREWFNSLPEG